MARITEPRVGETSTTAGAGPWTTAAALTSHVRFSAVCSVADTFWADIEAVDANGVPTGQWVEGLATYSALNEITLTTPYRGSSGNATPVTFSAGTQYIRLIADARQIAKLEGIAAGATVSGANSGDQDLSSYATTAAVAAGYQPLDSDLTALAGLNIAADKLPYGNGSHTMALADFTAAGRALVDDADAAAQRATLSLDNLTNDVQTKAAIVPNTAPAAGEVLIGNGSAFAKNAISGAITLSSAGVATFGTGAGNLTALETLSLYGDGTDGNVTISSGTTTLTRTMYYNNLTISGTGSLNPNGQMIYVKGTLDISAAPASAIYFPPNAGGNASVNTGGTAAATLQAGLANANAAPNAGKNGSTTTGNPSTSTITTLVATIGAVLGGNSGSSGTGGNGTSGNGGAGYTKAAIPTVSYGAAFTPIELSGTGAAPRGGALGAEGGSAGGDGTAGGGSGGGPSGGGVITIHAATINRGASTAAAAIYAPGGKGGDGGTAAGGNRGGGGGASGAGGGVVILMYATLTGAPATGAISVPGGAGGTGGSKTGTGADGAGGDGGDGGRYISKNSTTFTVTNTLSANTGSAHSGTTGGAGATQSFDL